jgi:hypothetical protein
MGITVAYRGRLADLTRVEDFEDRLLDLALELGAQAQIWRSRADDDLQRMVRGVILSLAPGLESTSMLVSPEGWLIGLLDIEDAERGRLTEPPWCFTKTQYGPLEGHVALVELLTALRREFVPDLEVSDEGGYWETRDLAELTRRHAQGKRAIDGLADGLRRHGLSSEAAEDPEILLRHIERVAAQVHRTLRRPADRPPVASPGDAEAAGTWPDPEAAEALADETFKHNSSSNAEDGVRFTPRHDERHPLLQRAMDLLKHLHEVFRDADSQFAPFLYTLFQGAGDATGGLAQALSARREEEDLADDFGLRATQLKRALRGVAFAKGALFSLRPAVSTEQSEELHDTLGQLEKDIFQQLGLLRSQHRPGGP